MQHAGEVREHHHAVVSAILSYGVSEYVVDRQIEPSNGNFVIAFVDGEFTIKQFKMDE